MRKLMLVRAGLTAILLATMLGASVASPAGAAPPAPFRYDALGDSYASGYGVPPYDNDCGQSQAAYALQLDGRMKIALDDFVACAGAKTTDIAKQLGALDAHTDLVTISVGGNDIRWSDAVKACLGGPDAYCMATVGAIEHLVTGVLPGLLDSVYADISEHAPNAKVLVVGYPRLFSPEYGDYSTGPLLATVAEQQALNDGADLLDSVIARAAAAHGFGFVDVRERFVGHGVNAPEPWIVGPLVPNAALHPNASGYQAYTAALTAAIVPARLR